MSIKVALVVEYHGGAFVGWQFQNAQRSVESELAQGISVYLSSQAKKLGIVSARLGGLSCSGRTDAGVHARGQVVSFQWPSSIPFDSAQFLGTLNGILAHDLCVREAQQVPETFDARKSLHRKCYLYSFHPRRFSNPLLRDRAWHVSENLDVLQMQRAAQSLEGTFDFKNFCSPASEAATTVRTLDVSEVFWEGSELLIFRVVGRGFLKNMVRIIAGYLIGIGSGVISVAEFEQLLTAESNFLTQHRARRAPSHGLMLEWVKYDNFLDIVS